MPIRKLTPILIVDQIEPLLPAWKALGFAAGAEIPHGDALGFVILASGGAEMMMQTRASLRDDLPAIAARNPTQLLYGDVASVDEAAAKLPGFTVLCPRRKTFYGALEIWLVDAAGTVIGLSEHAG